MQARCSPFSTRTVVEPLTSMSNDDDEDDWYWVWWKLQCLIVMMKVIIGGIVLVEYTLLTCRRTGMSTQPAFIALVPQGKRCFETILRRNTRFHQRFHHGKIRIVKTFLS